ncbi:hypothetical protein BDV3_000995 [Batrachochytrium dendrobatidis]
MMLSPPHSTKRSSISHAIPSPINDCTNAQQMPTVMSPLITQPLFCSHTSNSTCCEQSIVEQHLILSYMNDMVQAYQENNGNGSSSDTFLSSYDALFMNGADHLAKQYSPLQSLVSRMVAIVRNTGDVQQKLQSAEARLRARDRYLQSTIMDTARHINELVSVVSELESDKEGLISQLEGSLAERRELESTLISLGYDVRNNTIKKELQQKVKASLPSVEVSTQTNDNSNANMGSASDSIPRDSTKSTAKNSSEETGTFDLDEIDHVASDLSGVIQQNELLQADLSLVRLQVEHLEAVGRERTAMITDLLKKMGRDESTTVERLRARTGSINMGGSRTSKEFAYDGTGVPGSSGFMHGNESAIAVGSSALSTSRARHRDSS